MVSIAAPIITFFVGSIIGLFFTLLSIRKNRLLWVFMQAQKRRQGIAFLEDDSKKMVERVVESFQNLSITESGQIIVITPGSVKPVAGTLIQTVNADLYKSITTPFALRRFIYERTRGGWSSDDIADFLEKIEKMESPEQLREEYKDLKTNAEIKEVLDKEIAALKLALAKKGLEKTEKATLKLQLENKIKEFEPYKKLGLADKFKYDIWISLPSSISAYVNTGLNRTSINLQDELKQITRSKMMGKKMKQWAQIGFFVLLVMIGLMLLLKFGGPQLAAMFQGGAAAAPQAPIIQAPAQIKL